jgi:glycosyltransferase involved in cell wall biosynthesis
MTETVSIVIPLYRTPDPEALLLGLMESLTSPDYSVEVLLIDDQCPEHAYRAALGWLERSTPTPSFRVRVLRLQQHRGQHAATLAGLRASSGSAVGIMDGDLQDSPEDMRTLIEHFRARRAKMPVPPEAIVAQRSGIYESAGRQRSGHLFRWLLHLQTCGRIPEHAGLFMVVSRRAVECLLALNDPCVHPLAGLARQRVSLEGVPIQRRTRVNGKSAYSSWDRASIAIRILVVNTPLQRFVAALRRRQPVTSVEFFADDDDNVATNAKSRERHLAGSDTK